MDASGLLAVCIQHEMDHLQGKVFVEYWSRLKQARVMAKLKKDIGIPCNSVIVYGMTKK